MLHVCVIVCYVCVCNCVTCVCKCLLRVLVCNVCGGIHSGLFDFVIQKSMHLVESGPDFNVSMHCNSCPWSYGIGRRDWFIPAHLLEGCHPHCQFLITHRMTK